MGKIITTQTSKRTELNNTFDAIIKAMDQLETLCVIEFATAEMTSLKASR